MVFLAADVVATVSDSLVTFQLHLRGDFVCTDWVEVNEDVKFGEITKKVAKFVEQSCDCFFLPSNITTPQFTCHQHPTREHHVTYRASVDVSMAEMPKKELEESLEEWPRVHRSILVQGEWLSVDDTCPVIIQSLEEEECEVTTTSPDTVTLNILLIAVASVLVVAVLGSVAVMMLILFLCKFRKKTR